MRVGDATRAAKLVLAQAVADSRWRNTPHVVTRMFLENISSYYLSSMIVEKQEDDFSDEDDDSKMEEGALRVILNNAFYELVVRVKTEVGRPYALLVLKHCLEQATLDRVVLRVMPKPVFYYAYSYESWCFYGRPGYNWERFQREGGTSGTALTQQGMLWNERTAQLMNNLKAALSPLEDLLRNDSAAENYIRKHREEDRVTELVDKALATYLPNGMINAADFRRKCHFKTNKPLSLDDVVKYAFSTRFAQHPKAKDFYIRLVCFQASTEETIEYEKIEPRSRKCIHEIADYHGLFMRSDSPALGKRFGVSKTIRISKIPFPEEHDPQHVVFPIHPTAIEQSVLLKPTPFA